MAATLSLGEALSLATGRLAAAGIEDPWREARRLVAHALGASADAIGDPKAMVDLDVLTPWLDRRAAREPLAYLTGSRGFWTLEIGVSPATLIPRPDSETLIEAALAAFTDPQEVRAVLDLGTGTGCLLLAALAEFPAAFGVGVDISPQAAALAAANAAACSLSSRAVFFAGDWAAALSARFDLILCNPPYIASAEIQDLMPEVSLYEPRIALDGGPGGLAAYARLLPGLAAVTAPGGIGVIELGAGLLAPVRLLAEAAGFTRIEASRDLAGIPRALVLRR